ncbi:MAG: dienelactone hydrolase family protein [Bacteroidales bacterium]
MNAEIVRLHDEYTQGGLTRRAFLDRLAQLAGGSAAAAVLLPRLDYVNGQAIVPEDDKNLVTARVSYDAGGTPIAAYQAKPKAGGKKPAVIVIHENRGLTPHIQDVARRVALNGFLALAPDMLSPLGGTPADETQGPQMIGKLNNEETVARLAAAVRYLAAHADSMGKVGVVGFCWGGGMVNQLAAAGTSLNAGVSYYGRQLPAADVPKIGCPLLLHYAALDERINAGIPEFEAALKANHKTYELYMYEGANHAFNNNTNAARYNKTAADLAWGRTIGWFRKYLK